MATTAPAPFSGTLKLSTYPNRYNTVVPPEGPFYRTGLKLTSTGPNPRPLTEGLDYYLCYYFKEAAEALKDQVFGGIMLLTETEVNYTIYSVGREYRVPQSEIGKFLVKPDMKDPRNVDWSSLMQYAPVVAPIDPPTNLAEAILRDDVVKALDDIRKGIIARAADMDTAYAEVTDLIFQVGKKIFDDNLYQHHTVKNAHQYTAEEVGALKVLQKAVDSTKAFGKTLDELTAIMKTNGIQQAHIDTLMPVVLGELRGRLKVLNNGALTFRTADSSHVITLQGDKFLITTNKPITVTADADNNEPGLAVEVTSGLNAMYVASGASAPIFNGAYLITPDMVSLYLSAVKLLPANAYFASTDTLKIFGNAKDYSPVSMNVALPTASETTEGLLLITNLSANISAGAAISQKAVNVLKQTLDNYVDNTYTVNGKPFVNANGRQEVTLLPSDIGLGNVQNTTPAQKPLTTAIINVLKSKALSNHTHTFADLTGVPTASDTEAGLVQLWDAIDATTDKVVTSKQGYNVQQRINSLRTVVNGLLPAWTSGGSQYGNPGYLPVPAVGSYEGFSRNIDFKNGAIKLEGDVLYALINCHSGTPDTKRIYYAYAQVDASNAVQNIKKTNNRYHPEGMTGKYPGVWLKEIVISGKDGMIANGSDGKYYFVAFDGTLNARKHTTVAEIRFPDYATDTTDPFVPNMVQDTLVFDGTNHHLIRADVAGNSTAPGKYRVGMYSFKASDLANQLVTPTQKNLGFVRKAGKCADVVEPGDLLTGDSNAGTSRFAYITDAAAAIYTSYWETTRGGTGHITAAYQSGKIRVSTNHRVAGFGPSTSRNYGCWSVAFEIDTDTGALSMVLNPFPLKLDTDTLYNGAGVAINGNMKWDGRESGFVVSTRVDCGDGRVAIYQVSTEIARLPAMELQTLPANTSFWDYLGSAVATGVASEHNIPDGRGSVYGPAMSAPLFFPGTRLIWTNNVLSTECVEVEYDPNTTYKIPGYGGFGPTNNRRSVVWSDYAAAAQVPLVCTPQFPNGKLDGAHFTGPGSMPYLFAPNSTTLTADRLSLSTTEWNNLRQMVIDQAPAGAANSYASERIAAASALGSSRFLIDFWVIGTSLTGGPLGIVQVTCMTASGDHSVVDNYYFQVTPRITAGVLSFTAATLTLLAAKINQASNVISLQQNNLSGGRNARIGQVSLVSVDGTNYRLSIPCAIPLNVVAGVLMLSHSINMVKSGSTFGSGVMTYATAYNYLISPQYEVYIPELQAYSRLGNTYDPSFLSGPQLNAINMTKGTTTVERDIIVSGVPLAEGWNFYIPEAMPWRVGSNYYTAPIYSVDLKAAFPGNYQNRTFYVHVVLTGQVVSYQLLASRQPDTDTRLYLGTVTTDASGITSIVLDKVKRLGGLKQLVEHAGSAYRHSLDVGVDLTLSAVGLLRKHALADARYENANNYLDSSKVTPLFSTASRSNPRVPVINTIPGARGLGNKADVFYPAPIAKLATAMENQDASDAGMYWIKQNIPFAPANWVNWTALPRVTPTKSLIRVRLYLPGNGTGNMSMKVNDQPITVIYGDSEFVDIPVVPGRLLEVRIDGSTPSAKLSQQSNGWMAFGVYDFDGTTETALAVSGVNTPFIYSSSENDFFGSVLTAEEFTAGVDTTLYYPVVTAGNCGVSPMVKFVPGDTTFVVATKWVGLNGLETATDLAVHLMPRL